MSEPESNKELASYLGSNCTLKGSDGRPDTGLGRDCIQQRGMIVRTPQIRDGLCGSFTPAAMGAPQQEGLQPALQLVPALQNVI